MPSELEQELELVRIAQAFLRHNEDTFLFANGPVVNATERLQHYPSDAVRADENPLVTVLRRVIYFQCYIRRFKGHIVGGDTKEVDTVDHSADFVRRLSDANCGSHRWDPFWQVYRSGVDGELQVQKGDVHRFPVPGEYAFSAGPGVRPVEGDFVSLQVLPESLIFQDGYYFCFGEEIGDEFDDSSKVRFYFNIEPDDAAHLVEYLTRELNRFQVPFRFKCPASPDNYERTDTAVLYVSSRWFQITALIVADLSEEVLSHLKPEVPLFCRQPWPGIGFAEDPEDKSSFGETRCRLVAEGIVDAWEQSDEPPGDLFLTAIRRSFTASGISLETPWLNAGTVKDYEFPAAPETRL